MYSLEPPDRPTSRHNILQQTELTQQHNTMRTRMVCSATTGLLLLLLNCVRVALRYGGETDERYIGIVSVYKAESRKKEAE